MYHHLDTSIRGHVFTIVLSLLLISLLQREVRMQFPELSILKIIEYLSEIQTVSVEMHGKTIHKIVKLSPEAEKLSKYFNLQQYLS